jgi:hypothetical protein
MRSPELLQHFLIPPAVEFPVELEELLSEDDLPQAEEVD